VAGRGSIRPSEMEGCIFLSIGPREKSLHFSRLFLGRREGTITTGMPWGERGGKKGWGHEQKGGVFLINPLLSPNREKRKRRLSYLCSPHPLGEKEASSLPKLGTVSEGEKPSQYFQERRGEGGRFLCY